MSLKRLVSIAALCAGLPAAAIAADYDPPIFVDEAPEVVPVEIGSGWYLRGDVGYNFRENHDNSDFSANLDIDDLPLFGLGEDVSYSDKHVPVLASIGAGYHFNDWLRGDLNLGFVGRERFRASGPLSGDCLGTETTFVTEYDGFGNQVGPTDETSLFSVRDCAASVQVNNERWTGMVNGYVDLGTFSGLTPYVGGGIGLLYTKSEVEGSARCSSETVTSDEPNGLGGATLTTVDFLCEGQDDLGDAPVTYRIDDAERDYALMYGLAAGFGYRLSTNTTLDLGYQYMSAPKAAYYTIDDDGLQTNEGIDFHQIKVGLRYDLW